MKQRQLFEHIERLKSQITSEQDLELAIDELKKAFTSSAKKVPAKASMLASNTPGDLLPLSSSEGLFIPSFLNNITDGVITVDDAGSILSANDTAVKLLGETHETILGTSFSVFTIDYGNFELLYDSYQSFSFKRHEKPFTITLKGNKKGKTYCEININRGPRLGGSQYVITFKDITEKLNAQFELVSTTEKLHMAEVELKLLSMVASKTSNAVIIMDASRNIEWVNEGFTNIFGYTMDEVVGKRPSHILQGPESNPATLHHINSSAGRKESFTTEVINYHKDGTKKWLQLDFNPVFNDAGQLTNFISIETDITANKLNQSALEEAKEKAESASQAKAQFLSTMSHEIRTPMNAVVGMSNLLLEEELSPKQREYLDTLKFSSDNLLNLINDILDFSKIEAGKIDFEHIRFDLHQLARGIRESNAYIAQEKGISLEVNYAPNVPQFVLGDPTRLGQILNNLTSNAVKFTETGSVALSLDMIIEEPDRFEIQFAVRDTGIGIAKEELDNIFDSFTQSDVYVTRKYGGTGLGLTITRQLVELQHGHIKVTSKEGEGSVFTVTLHFDKAEPVGKAKNTSPRKQDSLEGFKILLVEDNQVNQFVAARFLEKWKSYYDIAENGQEALDLLEYSNYDLILMDIQMPVKDGFDTTRALRSSDKQQHREIPIIALTAGNVLEIQNEAMEIGMNDFVTKPFNPVELYSKISKHLQA